MRLDLKRQGNLHIYQNKKQKIRFTSDVYNRHITRPSYIVSNKPNIKNNYIQFTEINNKSLHSSIASKPALQASEDNLPKARCMTKPPLSSSGDGASDNTGPNATLSSTSHRAQLKNVETKRRLNLLKNFNITSDVNNGTYPTPGELIKNNGFGKPSKN